jgi:hypothetical protein
MKRLLQSIVGGTLLTILLFILILLLDLFIGKGDSDIPIWERTPFAWVLWWPQPLLKYGLHIRDPLLLVFFCDAIAFSLLIYLFLWLRKMQNRLP